MFSWGDGSRGQLGSPPSKDFTCFDVPQPVAFCSETISDASCGEQHTLFLTVDGRVLSCGRNNEGQLGKGKSKDSKGKLNGQTYDKAKTGIKPFA